MKNFVCILVICIGSVSMLYAQMVSITVLEEVRLVAYHLKDSAYIKGDGSDFSVFENGFSDCFLELVFVEVSSGGVNYFRFLSHSQTQTDTQVGGLGKLDPTLNNLEGKYRALFGTPFDLSELTDDPLLDKNSITHILIMQVMTAMATPLTIPFKHHFIQVVLTWMPWVLLISKCWGSVIRNL